MKLRNYYFGKNRQVSNGSYYSLVKIAEVNIELLENIGYSEEYRLNKMRIALGLQKQRIFERYKEYGVGYIIGIIDDSSCYKTI